MAKIGTKPKLNEQRLVTNGKFRFTRENARSEWVESPVIWHTLPKLTLIELGFVMLVPFLKLKKVSPEPVDS